MPHPVQCWNWFAELVEIVGPVRGHAWATSFL